MQSTLNKKHDTSFKGENIVKIAVQYDKYPAQLIEFDQQKSLDKIVQDLCHYPDWNITKREYNYALQFNESGKYVTEENRSKVKNGAILVLTLSAAKIASDIIKILECGSPGNKLDSLQNLCMLAKDFTFASEFFKLNGLDLLIQFINTDKYKDEMLVYILVSFNDLMEHGIVAWTTVEYPIIQRIIRFVNQVTDLDVVQPSLAILDNIIQNSANPNSITIKLASFIRILEAPNATELIQQNTIALLNTYFQTTNDQRKESIASEFGLKKYRDIINGSVFKSTMGRELRYQLYVFQTLLLSLYSKRMMTLDEHNEIPNKIRELKQIAFTYEPRGGVCETDSLKRLPKFQMKLQNKLGFKSEMCVEESFKTLPPGLLPLDCLLYFAQNYTTIYKNLVVEINSTSDLYVFPLGEVSIELTKLLCDFLGIGVPPCEHNESLYQMLFSHEFPLYELFCICIMVINETWKDMKATTYDFDQVLSVTKDQITRVLVGKPSTLNDFKRIIKTFTYAKITKLREEERTSRQEYESTVSAIVQLKTKLIPDMLTIIEKQRLNYLIQGSRFYHYSKTNQRLKDNGWYARLSTNHRVLHYGPCKDVNSPTLDELKTQIKISDIKELLVGNDCPIAKRKGRTILKCVFAIVYLDQSLQPCEPLEFIAADELTQNYWVDGLSILLKKDMESNRKTEDLDTLLSMEIKLKLLDTEEFEIKNDAPPIPADPDDYQF